MFTLSLLWAFVHLLGLFLLAGGMLGSVVTERLLWHRLSLRATAQALALLPLLRRFATLSLAGLALLLLSGFLLLFSASWSVQEMGWRAGKLILSGLMLLNGLLVAQPTTNQLMNRLMQTRIENATPTYHGLPADYLPIRQRLSCYNLSQFGLLLGLLALTVSKPF